MSFYKHKSTFEPWERDRTKMKLNRTYLKLLRNASGE